ncbi:hypothetical protein PROFUN_04687 [Planoprotostelium fungivorum]|uniref:F-box domain-containing protein n=1 Tax=Planoprotostelium fungivorum TaxID=1890364 RepID=A0A2P6NFU0_9EUKA|nr:hypothetical protein PROFUN_04687 [Planoprotostelium fungivorum]
MKDSTSTEVETLEKIFQFVGVRGVMISCRAVCRLWYRTSQRPELIGWLMEREGWKEDYNVWKERGWIDDEYSFCVHRSAVGLMFERFASLAEQLEFGISTGKSEVGFYRQDGDIKKIWKDMHKEIELYNEMTGERLKRCIYTPHDDGVHEEFLKRQRKVYMSWHIYEMIRIFKCIRLNDSWFWKFEFTAESLMDSTLLCPAHDNFIDKSRDNGVCTPIWMPIGVEYDQLKVTMTIKSVGSKNAMAWLKPMYDVNLDKHRAELERDGPDAVTLTCLAIGYQEREEIYTLCSSCDLPPSYPRFEARDHCLIVVSNLLPPVSSCDPHGTKIDPMDVDETHPLPAACDGVDDHELNDPMDWVYTLVDRIKMILLSPNSLLNELGATGVPLMVFKCCTVSLTSYFLTGNEEKFPN